MDSPGWIEKTPRLPSDGFFERDASHLLTALSTHPGVASEKALASSANDPKANVPLHAARTSSATD
jgi:hypothetical protein